MLNATEIQSGLAHFYGTEAYHRLSIFGGLIATDGVRWLAENAGCFWLMDEIGAAQASSKIKGNEGCQFIQFWTLKVKDNKAELVCEEDTDKPVYSKKIPYTDFPLPEIRLYVQRADERTFVVMLPSEY